MKAEGDFAASTKEAEQAGQQLIKERETLAEKIQKLKVPFKRIITHLEMEETSIKQTAFQKPLDMKNDQSYRNAGGAGQGDVRGSLGGYDDIYVWH